MPKSALFPTAASLICLAGLLACGGDAVTAPKDNEKTADSVVTKTNTDITVARVTPLLQEISSGETAASNGMSAGGVGFVAPASRKLAALTSVSPALYGTVPAENPAQCLFDSTKVRFNCPGRTQGNGLAVATYFQILDTAGKPQAHFDTLSSEAILKVTDVSGTVSQPLMTQAGPIPATQTTANHNELTLSHIRQPGLHKQNGTGTMHQIINAEGRSTADINATTTTKDFAFTAGKPYPTSGVLTAVVVTLQDGNTSTTNQSTTYDGTAIAKLVITFLNGQKRTCTYDMTVPNVPAVCTGP